MYFIRNFLVAVIVLVVTVAQSESKLISAYDIAIKFGYEAEIHHVITEDYYNLTLHRILSGNNSTDKKIPVLFMHGLGASSANYVDMGPSRGLGFILADLGYDVWLGNARGNSYSDENIKINRTEDPGAFYNFSWHEIGALDIPANIDYILETTGEETIQYIGHSQGCTAFYVLASTKPEYNSKIRLASLMGPAGLEKNIPNILLRIVSEFIEALEILANDIQFYHLPMLHLIRPLAQILCAQEEFVEVCSQIFWLVGGYPDSDQLDPSIIPTIMQTIPSDISMKQLLHYGQGVKSGYFRQYDWGLEGNRMKYGSDTPPEYNISAITAPVALYYGKNDQMVSPLDVNTLAAQLPNLVNNDSILYEKFNHADFLYATNVTTLLYDEMIETMKKY